MVLLILMKLGLLAANHLQKTIHLCFLLLLQLLV